MLFEGLPHCLHALPPSGKSAPLAAGNLPRSDEMRTYRYERRYGRPRPGLSLMRPTACGPRHWARDALDALPVPQGRGPRVLAGG